jgi:hypothetical protein
VGQTTEKGNRVLYPRRKKGSSSSVSVFVSFGLCRGISGPRRVSMRFDPAGAPDWLRAWFCSFPFHRSMGSSFRLGLLPAASLPVQSIFSQVQPSVALPWEVLLLQGFSSDTVAVGGVGLRAGQGMRCGDGQRCAASPPHHPRWSIGPPLLERDCYAIPMLRPLAGQNLAPPVWARCWAGPLTRH